MKRGQKKTDGDDQRTQEDQEEKGDWQMDDLVMKNEGDKDWQDG